MNSNIKKASSNVSRVQGSSIPKVKLSVQRPSGGRPSREQAKLLMDKLLEAATTLFLDNGYKSTSIENISALAGVSKRTFYSRFSGKDEIFKTVIKKIMDEGMREIEESRAFKQEVPFREWLRDVGLVFLEFNLRPDVVEACRLLIAEARRFPDLVKDCYTYAGTRIIPPFKAAFEKAALNGEIKISDVAFSIEMFFQCCIGLPRRRVEMGFAKPGLDDQAQKVFMAALENFLHGCHCRRDG